MRPPVRERREADLVHSHREEIGVRADLAERQRLRITGGVDLSELAARVGDHERGPGAAVVRQGPLGQAVRQRRPGEDPSGEGSRPRPCGPWKKGAPLQLKAPSSVCCMASPQQALEAGLSDGYASTGGELRAVTTVTGRVNLRSTRCGRSWRSHRDSVVGKVEMTISSIG